MITEMKYKLEFIHRAHSQDSHYDCFKLSIGDENNYVKFYTINGYIKSFGIYIEKHRFDYKLDNEIVKAYCNERFRQSYVDFIIHMIHPKLLDSRKVIAASSAAIREMRKIYDHSPSDMVRQSRWLHNNNMFFFTDTNSSYIAENGELINFNNSLIEKIKKTSLDDEIFNIWVGR